MTKNIFLTIYFGELYLPEEHDKISLCSRDFYTDCLAFYCKETNEDKREGLLNGIRFLSFRVTRIDESFEIMRAWEQTIVMISVREMFFRKKPNLVTEFKTEVSSILNARKEEILDRKRKSEVILKEESKTAKVIIDSLIKSKKISQPPPAPTGFQSCLAADQIESLFQQMTAKKYIITSFENFEVIFSSNPLPPEFIPIKTSAGFTNALCAYFISALFQNENPSDYWRIAQNCFDVKNLRQSLNNAYQVNSNQKPRGHREIDTILKNIYNHLL